MYFNTNYGTFYKYIEHICTVELQVNFVGQI
jgi:hypothetical protein